MNKALVVVLCLSLGFLAACTGGGNAQTQTGSTLTPFIGGTQGLAISFAEGMPPLEVFDDGQSVFSVGVLLENVGESAVGNDGVLPDTQNPSGYIEIVGINPDQFLTIDEQNSEYSNVNGIRKTFAGEGIELVGARRGFDGTVIPGDADLIEFPNFRYVNDRFGNTDVTIRANVCYMYRTYVDAKVCFKDSLIENARDSTICQLAGPRQFSSSSGPVQVTQVTQNPAGSDKVHVTFVVENLGTGVIFAPNQGDYYYNEFLDDVCSFDIRSNVRRDVVGVQVTLGSWGECNDADCPIDCPLLQDDGNTGFIRLFQGAPSTVTCTIDAGEMGSSIFTDNLLVVLDYTYLDFVETPVLIRDANVGFIEPTTELRN